MRRKLIIVINGKGGCGKDTLCEALRRDYAVSNVSAIDPIKAVAVNCGWDGAKTDKDRKFLAAMKRIVVEYNDLPNRYLLEQVDRFRGSGEDVMCVHVREPGEIRKFVASVDLPVVTILVRRHAVDDLDPYGNPADDNVADYPYDRIFDNDADPGTGADAFRALVRGIMRRLSP